ncbi:MAG TPA: ABC transporter substrate-binding protein [Candidatus Limnocylindrales bacterium]|nr:ABC transporter substrate-binding protein [Candidatus Limnocylindrales bacterium]
MVNRPRWLTLATTGVVAALVIVACTGPAATPTPAPTTPQTAAPSTGPTTAPPPTTGPTTGPTDAPTDAPTPALTPYPDPLAQPPAPVAEIAAYPEYGEIDCAAKTFNGLPYTGSIKRISAADAGTVVFELCAPDPAFLAKIAFSAFAIDDADYLIAHGTDGSIVREPNGTGPYTLGEWREGDQVILNAYDGYWGAAPLAPTAIFRWSSEPGQKFVELQSGAVDGIDNVQPDDVGAIEANANLQLIPREGMNTFYVGMNVDYSPFSNERFRQGVAMGVDRQALIDQFFPAGSETASHFTPCSIAFACEGDAWYEFDAVAGRAMVEEALAEEGISLPFQTKVSLRVVDRSYLPLPEQVAQAIAAQLETNLGIVATIDVQESTTFIDNADAGLLDGFHLLGWGADYPDPTNFLDYHFGPGASVQFGAGFPDIHEALGRGNSTAVEADRQQAYEDANNLVRQHVPMVPISHAGSATAWQAGLTGNPHSSPLGNESLAVIGGGADDQLVFMQSGEPGGLYCADESDGEALRVCEQIKESLYAYEVGATEAIPSLATECTANEDLSIWTCALEQGVSFHDGSTLDASDVVLSYAVQWDNLHPLHIGRDGSFTYFSSLWGGFLNPPAPCGLPNSDPCPE